jgi:hypothetical protein
VNFSKVIWHTYQIRQNYAFFSVKKVPVFNTSKTIDVFTSRNTVKISGVSARISVIFPVRIRDITDILKASDSVIQTHQFRNRYQRE